MLDISDAAVPLFTGPSPLRHLITPYSPPLHSPSLTLGLLLIILDPLEPLRTPRVLCCAAHVFPSYGIVFRGQWGFDIHSDTVEGVCLGDVVGL